MNNEIYPSFGKSYNGEKAIISLTSWKARINTVGLTLFNLRTMCPGFHLVLVLAIEEFPEMMNDLPVELGNLEKANICEFLWVSKNYKSFKKVIFTMHKYNTVPIISADDDCIYVCNYANELYNAYLQNQSVPINYRASKIPFCTCGPATIYPPSLYDYIWNGFLSYNSNHFQDDGFFTSLFKKISLQPLSLHMSFPCFFHDEIKPLTGSARVTEWLHDQRFI